MRPRHALALSAVIAAAAALSASPAAALCNIGGVEKAGPNSVWIYFLTPTHLKITHGGATRVTFVQPPRGNLQGSRPAVLAEMGDKLYSDEMQCYMQVRTQGGQIGVKARRWGQFHTWGTIQRGEDWAPNDAFMPARTPRR
jgi:hypothetical protein